MNLQELSDPGSINVQCLGEILYQGREKSPSRLDGSSLKNRAQRLVFVKLGEIGKI